MKSDAVKIAESQERARLYEVVGNVLTNPAIDLMVGYVLFEYLSSYEDLVDVTPGGSGPKTYKWVRRPGTAAKSGWFGPTASSVAEGALVASLSAASIGKISKELKPLAEALAPLMLTKGL